MGRVIPAGTGFEYYGHVRIPPDEPPPPPQPTEEEMDWRCEPDAVPQVVAAVLDERDARHQLATTIAGHRRIRLVLDTCGHVISACRSP